MSHNRDGADGAGTVGYHLSSVRPVGTDRRGARMYMMGLLGWHGDWSSVHVATLGLAKGFRPMLDLPRTALSSPCGWSVEAGESDYTNYRFEISCTIYPYCVHGWARRQTTRVVE
eukprot:2876069-Prymnesium_polylepis.1